MQIPTVQDLKKLIPKIELVPIDQVKLNPDNPRRITEKKFKELVKSVEDFYLMLFFRPVVLNEEGMAIGGNQRTLAARRAGLTHVPCLRADQMTPQQQREFIIKDNNSSGEWNFDSLANDWSQELLLDWGLNPPGLTDPPGEKLVQFKAKDKSISFDIRLKADTELERQQLITKLHAAGLVQDEHYFLN